MVPQLLDLKLRTHFSPTTKLVIQLEECFVFVGAFFTTHRLILILLSLEYLEMGSNSLTSACDQWMMFTHRVFHH